MIESGRGVEETARPSWLRGRRRGIWLLVACVAVAAIGVGSWAVGSRIQSSSEAAAKADPPEASWITAPVELRQLSSTVIQRGDVQPEILIEIGAPLSVTGTPVVTGVAGAVGDEVAEGAKVVEVSGRPVFVMTGAVPVYREMRPGMAGSDIGQLQAGLTRLGCAADIDAGTYASATKSCVADLYARFGYSAMSTSATDEAGLAAARQAVIDAQATLDDAQFALDRAMAGPQSSTVTAAKVAVTDAKRGLDDATAAAATSVADAQRMLDEAIAGGARSVADAVAAQAVAKAALDRLLADPEALAADVAEARVTSDEASSAVATAQFEIDSAVAAAQSALTTAQRNGESSVAAALGAVQVADANYADVTRQQGAAPESVALLRATQARDQAVASLTALDAVTGAVVPQGEVVFVPSLPARIVSTPASLGGSVSSAGDPATGAAPANSSLVTLAAGELLVTTSVRSSDAGLVRVGMDVEILDELNNVTIPARVRSLASEPVTGDDGALGYLAVIQGLAAMAPSLTGSNVRLTFTAAATEGEVLVVPLAAVSADVSGAARVQRLDGEGVVVDVPVSAGLSADGYLEVTPLDEHALQAGDIVVVGR